MAAFDRAAARQGDGATHLVSPPIFRTPCGSTTRRRSVPAWYVKQPGIMKIFPPDALKPYIPADYSDRISAILVQRCQILRKYGLRALIWRTNAGAAGEGV